MEVVRSFDEYPYVKPKGVHIRLTFEEASQFERWLCSAAADFEENQLVARIFVGLQEANSAE